MTSFILFIISMYTLSFAAYKLEPSEWYSIPTLILIGLSTFMTGLGTIGAIIIEAEKSKKDKSK